MLTYRETCDSCGGGLRDVFSMGSMPLANRLLKLGDLMRPGESYPLIIAECADCSLAQLRYVVDPVDLYRDYRFFTGASFPSLAYFSDLSEWIKSRVYGKRALEIGSNDGTMLFALEQQGFDVTGVDPAEVQCQMAKSKLTHGDVKCEYWSDKVARTFDKQFDVVVACNVLGHSADLNDFVQGIKRVLGPDGLFVIEVQYLKSLMDQAAFEIIYHEHVSYFDERSLSSLLERNGFRIHGWMITEVQCGTLRMWASVSPSGVGIGAQGHNWMQFRKSIGERRDAVMSTMERLQQEGRRICFYGAPAKATQLANYWRLGTDTIEFATDTTPAKQGCLIPGAMIPIVAPDYLRAGDAAIVAAWNFYSQIVQRETAFVATGGKLICPTIEGCQLCTSSV